MNRTDQRPHRGDATAIMGQDSVESGRHSIEQRYDALVQERKIISERKIVLERQLCQFKLDDRHGGRRPAAVHQNRFAIIEEINEIQQRLVQIKPNMAKLNNEKDKETNAWQTNLLKEILSVLKEIREGLK